MKEAYPDLNIETAAFSSSDEAVTKMQAGFQADVVNVCVRDTQRLVDLDLLQPIDTSRIEGWDTILDPMKEFVGVEVNDQVYMVPNVGGTAGIVYDPDMVSAPITSYKELFEDTSLAGKVTVEDVPYYSIAVGALALGYENPYVLTDEDLAKVRDYYIEHKSQFRTFYATDADWVGLYKGGEIVAGQGFSGYPSLLSAEGEKSVYVPADEGTLTWTCGLGIAKNSQNVDAAYAIINSFINPVAQTYFAETYKYLVSDQRTIDELPKNLVEEIGASDPAAFSGFIATEIPENYSDWLDTWREIKSS